MATIDQSASTLRGRLLEARAEWTNTHLSTNHADRERTERAIRGLYTVRGLAAPTFEWVTSPAAGVEAYALTAAREPVVDPYVVTWGGLHVRGWYDRYFESLGDPFALRPARRRSMVTRLTRALATIDPPLLPSSIRPLGSAVVGSLAGRFPFERDFEPYRAPKGTPGGGRYATRPRDAGPAEAIAAMQLGQFDLDAAALDLLFSVFDPRLTRRARWDSVDQTLLHNRLEVARSAGPWWAVRGLAVVSERPELVAVDDHGRLHSPDGPAIRYRDGFSVWAIDGVAVPAWVVTSPERIDVELIDDEPNTEVRRVMIERFGYDRLLRDGKAELVDEDEFGRLWRRFDPPVSGPRWMSGSPKARGPLREALLEVVNSTPEPDGSFKTYFLRVPPGSSSAREAVAWTFGLEAERYIPAHQT